MHCGIARRTQQRISKVEVVRRCEKILSMGYVPMSQCPGAMVCVGALQWRSGGLCNVAFHTCHPSRSTAVNVDAPERQGSLKRQKLKVNPMTAACP